MLCSDQCVVVSFLSKQFLMCSLLYHLTIWNDHDLVCCPNCWQTMSNDNSRPTSAYLPRLETHKKLFLKYPSTSISFTRGKIKKYLLCMLGIPRGSENNQQKNKTRQNTQNKNWTTNNTQLLNHHLLSCNVIRYFISPWHKENLHLHENQKEQEWPNIWHYGNFVPLTVKQPT